MNILEAIDGISADRLRADLFSFCRDPFTFRTVLYTAPWHEHNSLDELDCFIADEMRKFPVSVNMLPNKIRPFRCDATKPLHHWYSAPHEDDPWFDAHNIEVIIPGNDSASEIIQLVSHKDSMSWINSPGAHDNAVGAVTNMELVRILSNIPHKRTIRVLFCNEEHSPWHSLTYAKEARKNNDNIIAVLNQDSLCGKSDTATAAGIRTNVTCFCNPEAKQLAQFIASRALKYNLPIQTDIAFKERVNDDDGSFIKAGYNRAVMNIGSSPYADPQYHLRGDIPERVDILNLKLAAQLILTAILELDQDGLRAME